MIKIKEPKGIKIRLTLIWIEFLLFFIAKFKFEIEINSYTIALFIFFIFILLDLLIFQFYIIKSRELIIIEQNIYIDFNYTQLDKIYNVVKYFRYNSIFYPFNHYTNSFGIYPQYLLFISYIMNKKYKEAIEIFYETPLNFKPKEFQFDTLNDKIDNKSILFHCFNIENNFSESHNELIYLLIKNGYKLENDEMDTLLLNSKLFSLYLEKDNNFKSKII
ncbi:hypothetical protein JXR93_00845 [bacterium]|nr:hypothetical protein [bacterium]